MGADYVGGGGGGVGGGGHIGERPIIRLQLWLCDAVKTRVQDVVEL